MDNSGISLLESTNTGKGQGHILQYSGREIVAIDRENPDETSSRPGCSIYPTSKTRIEKLPSQ